MDDLEFGTSIVSTAYGAYLDHAYAQNLANHLLCAFVANLKIGTIYAFYPESFCDKNLALWKVFFFSDLLQGEGEGDITVWDDFYSKLCDDIKVIHIIR